MIAIGLPVAKGQLLVTSFYEDVSPEARRWTDRFMARTHRLPTETQAGVYSSVRHMLQAVKDTNSDDGETVAARMRSDTGRRRLHAPRRDPPGRAPERTSFT